MKPSNIGESSEARKRATFTCAITRLAMISMLFAIPTVGFAIAYIGDLPGILQ